MTRKKSDDPSSLPEELQPDAYGPHVRHTFIVNIWLEEKRQNDHVLKWRGTVSHTNSGKRRAVSSPRDLLRFIKQYLTDKPDGASHA